MSGRNFRTANDIERARRAADVVANKLEAATHAKEACDAAEASCVNDPTEHNFGRAREERQRFEEAERVLELARAHEAKIEAETAASERATIAAEIARFEATVPEVVDDEARELAVEIGVLSARLLERITSRKAAVFEAHEGINALRARVGAKQEPMPASSVDGALRELVRVAWLAQEGTAAENAGGYFCNFELAARTVRERSLDAVAVEFGGVVRELRQRVEARRASRVQKPSSPLAHGIPLALAALSALTLAGA